MALDVASDRKQFPSPLGVIFSLIYFPLILYLLKIRSVSVSSRSYILSYQLIIFGGTLIQVGYVSVSSRSYILSYEKVRTNYNGTKTTQVSVSSRSYILSYTMVKKHLVCNSL